MPKKPSEILWEEKIQSLLHCIFASYANKCTKQFLGLPKLLGRLRADQRLKTQKIIRGRLRQMVANGTLAQANAKVKRINGRNVTDILVSPGRKWSTMRKTRNPHGNISVVQTRTGGRDATGMGGVAGGSWVRLTHDQLRSVLATQPKELERRFGLRGMVRFCSDSKKAEVKGIVVHYLRQLKEKGVLETIAVRKVAANGAAPHEIFVTLGGESRQWHALQERGGQKRKRSDFRCEDMKRIKGNADDKTWEARADERLQLILNWG